MGGRCDVSGSEHQEGAACPGPGVVAATTVMRPPDAPRATVLPPGTMLEGVYRIGECIAKGGMGGIYVAEHVALGKRFAVKVLSGLGVPQPDLVERLRIEARAASAVEHENVVRVSHLGRTDDGSVFIVMELIQGESLRDRLVRQSIEGGPKWLPDAETLATGEQILEGLDAAHRAGIVHRDLKPENVMLATVAGPSRRHREGASPSKCRSSARPSRTTPRICTEKERHDGCTWASHRKETPNANLVDARRLVLRHRPRLSGGTKPAAGRGRRAVCGFHRSG